MSDPSPALEPSEAPESSPAPMRMPLGVMLWFGWAFLLLAGTGILLPRIIEYVDFSERAPFSLLGIFMMLELAFLLFGITVAMQRKRIAHRFAIGIAILAAPLLAGLPPILLDFPPESVAGWQGVFIPVGLAISVVLIVGLLRPASRAYFSED